MVSIPASEAQNLCANINYLIDQSKSKFSKIMGKSDGEMGSHDATFVLANASQCVVTTKSTKSWYRCSWKYPYRNKRAYDSFDDFVEGMNQCIGHIAKMHVDHSVNHPDYYASRRYEMEQAAVSVSIKDKSALGSTLVSIRVEGRSKNN